MNFQTVTMNESGIPRVILGPNRKSQDIEIIDVSGNKIPRQFPGGFYWDKFPVYFKPKWLYQIPDPNNHNVLQIGLREEAKPWPRTSKTARIVVYSNGDSEDSHISKRKAMSEYEWTHEHDDDTTTDETINTPPMDSAINYIEIVYDPEL